jgi:hypothetical protein
VSAAFEAFLARIYTDVGTRARFLEDPRGEAGRAGLDPREQDALAAVDRVGLEMAAWSFAAKRAAAKPRRRGWWPPVLRRR